MSMQELEDILDDDQDMEDMYLGRRLGEEAVTALQQMAEMAQMHADDAKGDAELLQTAASTQSTSFQVNLHFCVRKLQLPKSDIGDVMVTTKMLLLTKQLLLQHHHGLHIYSCVVDPAAWFAADAFRKSRDPGSCLRPCYVLCALCCAMLCPWDIADNQFCVLHVLQSHRRYTGTQQAPPPPQSQQSLSLQPNGAETAQTGDETDAAEIGLLTDTDAEAVPGDMRLPPEALFQRAKSAIKQRSLAPEENMAE